ncbi:MAG: type II toxin-antitoxin system Phd/YefM family antitoxin [Candidatus Omnitrophica bacterium]|nr:type II toxin-antitoxin system Phd/YefM family antitoxin [Candidatus Omnitrophota bacterium]
MTKMLPASEVKTKFFKLLEGVDERDDEIVITKNGKPIAMFVNFKEFESLMETMDILSDPKAMKRIREAEEYIKKGGRLLTFEEVFGFPEPWR